MKKIIALAMTVIMFAAICTVSVTSVSAQEGTTVNGVSANVGDIVTVNYYVTSDDKWEDFEGYFTYDYNGLKLDAYSMSVADQGIMIYNTTFAGIVRFNGSCFTNPYDFTTERVLYTAQFTVLAEGTYTIDNQWDVIHDTKSVSIAEFGNIDAERFSARMDTKAEPKPIPTTSSTTKATKPKPTTSSSSSTPSTSGSSSVTSSPESSSSSSGYTTPPVTFPDNVLVTSVKLNKTSTAVYKGKTYRLTATVAPANATNKGIKWSTSNASVVKISSTTGNAITITGVKAGIAYVTAKAIDGSGKYAKCKVFVRQPVTKITMSKSKAVVYTGKKITLKAKVYPANAYNKSVLWKTSNSKVAKVSQSGVVAGLKKGTAKVTATAKDGSKKSASCVVTVRQSVTKIKLSKTVVNLQKKGKTATVKATVYPKTAYNKYMTVKSANKNVAVVSSSKAASGKNVKITAKGKGNTKITFTAKDGSRKSAICKVTVKK